MAAESDLLADVFSNRAVDEKVVSEVVRAFNTLLRKAICANLTSGFQLATNHFCSLSVVGSFNVEGSK